MKFASRPVKDWKNRHLNHHLVMDQLRARMQRGYTLTADERQYWDDTRALVALYN